MGRKDAKKRQKDLKRRLQQGSVSAADVRRSREELAAALGDPQQFTKYLQVFGQLALLWDSLYTCRFPGDPFVQAVLAAEVAGEEGPERALAFRRAVIPGLVSTELLDTCQAAIQQTMEQVEEKDALLALTAAGALLTSCREEAARHDHPFWDILFEVSLSEAILSGHFLIQLVLAEHPVDEAEAGRAFTKALAQGDLSRELFELGLEDPAPAKLAAVYAQAVREPGTLYHLQFDAVLHLANAHVDLAAAVGRRIAASGVPPELRAEVLAAYEQAYLGDVTENLAKELAGWFRGRLETLRDEPDRLQADLPSGIERERDRCLATYLALQAIPPAQNAMLRAVHVQSLERARTQAPELEQGFVFKLWSQPTDRFTLEEYERFLLERREPNRSRRVRDYRAALETKPEEPAKEEGQS